jgi:hypothetical protein
MPEDDHQLNGRNIPYENSVKYLGVTFDRRMAWRLHIEKTAAKAWGTYIRTYSIFKSKHLRDHIKLIMCRALIKSIMTYACSTWEFSADTHLMKLQRLQNRVLRAIDKFDRSTPVRDLHLTFKIPYVYDYINFAAIKPTIVQASNCRFGGLNKSMHSLLYTPALTEVPVHIKIKC